MLVIFLLPEAPPSLRRSSSLKDCIGAKYKKPTISFDKDVREWFNTGFTKIILEVSDKGQFNSIIHEAEKKGFLKDEDFFVVDDLCHTELTPENEDGTCSTCIGFKPMDSSKIDGITKKLRLFRE